MVVLEGYFANHDETFYGQVEVGENGIFSRVSKQGSGKWKLTEQPDHVFDENHLIFPGMVDAHIHAREDETKDEAESQRHKETYVTANNAAINGGVVCAAAMPNTPKPLVTRDQLGWHNVTHADLPVTFVNYVGVGPGTSPLTITVPYKVYTGPSVGPLFFKDEAGLREVLQHYRGEHVSFHVEDFDVLQAHRDAATHTERRPVECVNTALKYVLQIIEDYDLVGKLCHWSTGGESLEMIAAHRDRGYETLLEVSPHMLIYDSDMLGQFPELWPLRQMNPALQSERHRLELIDATRSGDINMVATDHAPHTLDEKFKAFAGKAAEWGVSPEQAYYRLLSDDRAECVRLSCLNGTSGTPQLDTVGLVAVKLMKEHDFTPQDIARAFAYEPGKFVNQFLGQDRRFGRIEAGYQGSVTVINTAKSTTVERPMLETKVRWSPFEGMTFPGRVAMTMVKGEIMKEDPT